MQLTEHYVLPWGINKGKKLGDVSGTYLLSLYERNKANGKLKHYIEQNMQILRLQKANNK